MQMQIIIDRFLRSEQSRALKLKPLDKLLMFFLASYMGKKDNCWPSYPILMIDLGIKDKTALSNSIKNLCSKNILYIQKRMGTSNIFRFNLEFIYHKSYTQPVGNPDYLPVGNPDWCSRDFHKKSKKAVGNPYTNNALNNKKNKQESDYVPVTSQSTSKKPLELIKEAHPDIVKAAWVEIRKITKNCYTD